MCPAGRPFRIAFLVVGAAAAIWLLYLFRLDAVGMLGPDEPRYAAIGRAMARTGDWVTPRLWGQPWFEKPALLYWMIALGDRLGFGDDLGPRLPIALLSVAFLLFFLVELRRGFGLRPAAMATIILATSAGWLAFSHAAVTDLPLAAFFSTALLLLLRPAPPRVTLAAACLGLAVLAKGLVPLVLILPALWLLRAEWRKLLRPLPLTVFFITAAPWYLLCWLRNGSIFPRTFFLEHQLGRFTSGALQHVQPFWFYVPVLLGLLFPWPLLLFSLRRNLFSDSRLRLLLATVLCGLLFFSVSRNKLPGYLLPLLPPLAALLGIALSRLPRAGALLSLSALLLGVYPLAIAVLPRALAGGLRAVWPLPEIVVLQTGILLPVLFVIAVAALFLSQSGRALAAVSVLGAAAAFGIAGIELRALPAVDYSVSARSLWRELPPAGDICVGNLNRSWRYGLNYYSVDPLPDCAQHPARTRILPAPGRPLVRNLPH